MLTFKARLSSTDFPKSLIYGVSKFELEMLYGWSPLLTIGPRRFIRPKALCSGYLVFFPPSCADCDVTITVAAHRCCACAAAVLLADPRRRCGHSALNVVSRRHCNYYVETFDKIF